MSKTFETFLGALYVLCHLGWSSKSLTCTSHAKHPSKDIIIIPHFHIPLPYITLSQHFHIYPFLTPFSYTPSSYIPSPYIPYIPSLYTPLPSLPPISLPIYPFPIHPFATLSYISLPHTPLPCLPCIVLSWPHSLTPSHQPSSACGITPLSCVVLCPALSLTLSHTSHHPCLQHPHLPYANFTTLANTKWLLQTQQLTCIYFGNKFSVLVLLEVTGNILPLAGLIRSDWQIPHLAGMTEVTGNTLAIHRVWLA